MKLSGLIYENRPVHLYDLSETEHWQKFPLDRLPNMTPESYSLPLLRLMEARLS